MKNSTIFNFVTSIINGGLQSKKDAESLTAIPVLNNQTTPPVYLQAVKTFFTKKTHYGVLAIVASFLSVSTVSAQQSDSSEWVQPKSKWHFVIEPYLIIPNMVGEISVRQLPASEVDADAGDIFGQLRMAGMIYLEAGTDKMAFSADLIFMDLKQEVTPGQVVTGGDAFAKQLSAEFAFLWKLKPWLDVGAAPRITDIKADLDIETVNGGRSGSQRKTWVDPVIILRAQTPLENKWILQFRGDIGGFGVGSDLTWQIQANAGYRWSSLFSTTVGYRILDIDYDKGDGADRFMYDIATSGITIRLGFSF
jgi:hypothetical protein